MSKHLKQEHFSGSIQEYPGIVLCASSHHLKAKLFPLECSLYLCCCIKFIYSWKKQTKSSNPVVCSVQSSLIYFIQCKTAHTIFLF